MKWFICLFLPLLSGISSLAQKFTYNQGGTSAKNYYEEIPYETVNGKLFVYVEVVGKKAKFLFDTGAPLAVSKELAARSGIIHDNILIDAYGNKDSALVVRLDSIRLGSLVFKNIPAISGMPDFYKCWDVEGVIGSNLLRNSIVRIDPVGHLIILTDQADKLGLANKKSIPLIASGIQSDPKIGVLFKGKVNLLLGFDTGDASFLRISEDNMDQLKRSGAYEILARGYGSHNFSGSGTERNADKYLLKVPFLNVGDGLFQNVVFETFKSTFPAIGSKLLEYGSVTLDYIHGKFYFDAARFTNDLAGKQWSFQPSFTDNKLVVGVVWEDGEAQVTPGQQIIAVDGIDCRHFSLCDLLQRGPILAGKEKVTLTVLDEQGNPKNIQMNKK